MRRISFKLLFLILLNIISFNNKSTETIKQEKLNVLSQNTIIGWDSTRTHYYATEDGYDYNGKKVTKGEKLVSFQKIDGNTYFFSRINDNGLRTGEFSIDGFEYKFNEDGTMYTGIYDNGKYKVYYGEDGKKGSGLQTYKGKTYFFSRVEPNKMRTGEFIIDGFEYKFNEDGTMYTGIYDNGEYKVYYGKDGKKESGFKEYKGNTYFFSRVEPNKMRTGEFSIDGFEYKFNEDGTMYTGIYDNGEYKVYYGKDGKKESGFKEYKGNTYFFSRVEPNKMRTGTFRIDKIKYTFNKDGVLTNTDDRPTLFLGDSITMFYDLDYFYYEYPVVNSGIAGNTTKDILENMEERVYKYNPNRIRILIGTNDIYFGLSNEETLSNISEIIKLIKENTSAEKIAIESIYPINNTNAPMISHQMVANRTNENIVFLNKKIEEICKKENIEYINTHDLLIDNDNNLKLEYTTDGLHISNLGYQIITNNLKKYFN